jgi:hypothetical protein
MIIKIKRGGIFIGRKFFSWDEFRFVCGALLSVLTSSEKEIYTGSGIAILKNERYEVHVSIPSSYDEVEWEQASVILKHILKFPKFEVPSISPHLVIEVKRICDGKDIYFWSCSICNRKATPKYFSKSGPRFICLECSEKEKQQLENSSS